MSTKAISILMLFLMLAGYSFAQYGYSSNNNDDEPEDPQLNVRFYPSCDAPGNIVYVKVSGNGEEGATVTVIDNCGDPVDLVPSSGKTGEDGSVSFALCDSPTNGCDDEVSIYASKSGFDSDSLLDASLIDCGQCQAPVQEPEPEPEPEPEVQSTSDSPPDCEAPGCCESHDACGQGNYCEMGATAAQGVCKPIVCGEISNNALVSYECGDGQGCPSCDQGQTCEAHLCVDWDLSAEDCAVGETCDADVGKDGSPSDEGYVVVMKDGQVVHVGDSFVPDEPGTYQFLLYSSEGGELLDQVEFQVEAPPAPPSPPQDNEDEDDSNGDNGLTLLLVGGLLLLGIVGGALLLLGGKKLKK